MVLNSSTQLWRHWRVVRCPDWTRLATGSRVEFRVRQGHRMQQSLSYLHRHSGFEILIRRSNLKARRVSSPRHCWFCWFDNWKSLRISYRPIHNFRIGQLQIDSVTTAVCILLCVTCPGTGRGQRSLELSTSMKRKAHPSCFRGS